MGVHLNDAEARLALEILRQLDNPDAAAVVSAKLRYGVRDLSDSEANVLMQSLAELREGNAAYFRAHDVTLTTLWRKLETP